MASDFDPSVLGSRCDVTTWLWSRPSPPGVIIPPACRFPPLYATAALCTPPLPSASHHHPMHITTALCTLPALCAPHPRHVHATHAVCTSPMLHPCTLCTLRSYTFWLVGSKMELQQEALLLFNDAS
ncbi:hypothetical protein GGX14DRAFT_562308 [Mycena pura]|uniref:Uncharacterized protein n=1 Tax=Mycena pura TaxID=153505 RepID=A0AAD6YGF7_9AGAR|nr:hypothetical protein GGX14DRAFT_562308 [Mycena pura]